MRDTPCASKSPGKTWLAASEGWNPSQNTYDVALEHVPRDLALQSKEVSSVPVPQQALLDSKKPATIIIPNSQGKGKQLVVSLSLQSSLLPVHTDSVSSIKQLCALKKPESSMGDDSLKIWNQQRVRTWQEELNWMVKSCRGKAIRTATMRLAWNAPICYLMATEEWEITWEAPQKGARNCRTSC